VNLSEALHNTKAPQGIIDTIVLVDIPYFGFNDQIHDGQLLIHKDLAKDVQAIFAELAERQFPIERIVPIVAYDWDDVASMSANNSSAFNYRVIAGTDRLSNHATGRALDINPIQNPYFTSEGISSPPGLIYDVQTKGTIIAEDFVVSTFKKRGWQWGGDWASVKDYQHFEKPYK
jgi:hypothetical protein